MKLKNNFFLVFFIFLFVFIWPLKTWAASLEYVTTKTFGGTNDDYVRGIVTDASRNIYITGTFTGTVDFDPGTGTDEHTSAGLADVYISKYDSSMNYIETQTFGGASAEEVYFIVIDSSSNILVGGGFKGTADFDPGAGTDEHTSAGDTDVFISKYDSSLNYVSTQTFGSTGLDFTLGATLDSSDNLYLAGSFTGTVDFDPGAGTDEHTSNGSLDVFMAKYDSSFNYVETQTFGSTGSDKGKKITVDTSDNIYLVGDFAVTVDFDPGGGTDEHTSAGSADIFLSKYNSSFVYEETQTFGGTSYDESFAIAADSSGNVYAGGGFYGTADFDPGAGTDEHTSNGDSDIFITKYDSSLNYIETKAFGGIDSDADYALAIDSADNVYAGGIFYGTADFDPGAGTDSHAAVNGTTDVFVSQYDSAGNYVETITFGGSSIDISSTLAVDADVLYVGGYFYSTVDFDPGAGTDEHTSAGSLDAFIAKYSIGSGGGSPSPSPAPSPGVVSSSVDINDELTVNTDDGTNNDEDDSPTYERAKITSWKAKRYLTESSCPEKIKLVIKGKHFSGDVEVYLGSEKASSVTRKNSRKIVAKFCLADLLDKKVGLKRKINVKNPGTEERKAAEKINLNDLEFEGDDLEE